MSVWAAGDPHHGASRWVRAGLEVTRSVAAAMNVTDAYKAVLPALCGQIPCQVARLWMRQPDGSAIVCVDYWYRDSSAHRVAASPFGAVCAPGEGLAGQCWAAGRALAVAVEDEGPLFPNQADLLASGIHTAAGAPLEGATGAIGAITLYFAPTIPLDATSLDLLSVLAEAIGAVLEAKQRDLVAREELRRHRLLLDASSAVASAGDYRATLRMLAASAVPGLADLCLIDLVGEDGNLERAAAAHADRTKAHLVEELERNYPPESTSEHPAGRVVATGRSSWAAAMSVDFLRSTTRDARHFEIVRQLGFESYLCVPLRVGSEVLGAITLVSAGSGRVFREADLQTAEQLAQQVAGTVGRARDLEREHARSEELRRRSAALVDLGNALSGATAAEQALDALLGEPVCSLGATVAWIGLLDDARTMLRLRLAGEIQPQLTARQHLLSVDTPTTTTDAVRANRRIVVDDALRMGAHLWSPLVDAQPPLRALAVEPVRAEDGSVLGAFGLAWPEPQCFSAADLAMLDNVAATLSRTMARILVAEREHQIATSIQERMLALEARSTAAVVAALYEPAGREMRVGGDWYTATALDTPARLGVSVGDVVGHGLSAVTTMSQLRSAVGVAALTAARPKEVIDLVDRYAASVPDAGCATVAYVLVDADAEAIEYACAGHPYPLLVTPDGQARWLEEGRRPPLSVDGLGVPAESGHSAFPPGSLLVLYSDGLIERHGESIEAGMARLAAAAIADARLPSAAFCAALRDQLAPAGQYGDDVVIVAIRPVGTTADSHVDCVRSAFAEIPGARHRLRAWLDGLALSAETINRILVAVGEAVNNAIEHGSELDRRRAVSIEAFVDGEVISASVGDSGHWSRDPVGSHRAGDRGRGLMLMHSFSDEVEIVRGPAGTRVTMRFARTQDPGLRVPNISVRRGMS